MYRLVVKIVVACFLIGFLPNMVLADDPLPEYSSDRSLSFGIKGGVNVNSFDNIQSDFIIMIESDDDVLMEGILNVSDGVDVGFNGGAYLRYPVTNTVGLQAEVLYNQQGGIRQKPSLLGVKRARVTMHNVEVPLLVDFKLFQSESLAGRIFAGGGVAYNVFSSQNFTNIVYDTQYDFLTLTEGTFEIVTSQYRRIQYGSYLGLRFDTLIGGYNLHLDLRYRWGIDRVNELRRISDQFDARANTFSVSVGIGL